MLLLSDVANFNSPKIKNGKVYYRGRYWNPNKPVPSDRAGKKKMVLASKKVEGQIKYKLLHFGAKGYGHNYSTKARTNYLKRSAGIKNKSGQSTATDKFSPNYWSRKSLWNRNTKPVGTGRFER